MINLEHKTYIDWCYIFYPLNRKHFVQKIRVSQNIIDYDVDSVTPNCLVLQFSTSEHNRQSY